MAQPQEFQETKKNHGFTSLDHIGRAKFPSRIRQGKAIKIESPTEMDDPTYAPPKEGPLLPEEEYLVGILTDRSGIDLTEFLLPDPYAPDRVWRTRPYQYCFWRSYEQYEIDASSRDVGKTRGAISRGLAFPFCFPGAEILYVAAEGSHLESLVVKIEGYLKSVKLLSEFVNRKRGEYDIRMAPRFNAKFINGASIVTRVPQKTGRGAKGVHAICIEVDEAQDMHDRAYTEMIESMRSGLKGAQLRLHGVSNADNGTFDRYLNSDSGSDIKWKKHRYIGPDRPDWTDQERKSKIELYGGVGATQDNPNYQRNVLGVAGNANAMLLSQRRLMACVRIGETPWAVRYNNEIYRRVRISEEALRGGSAVLDQVWKSLSEEVLSEEYTGYRIGADLGFTNDPTECLVFGEIDRGHNEEPLLRLLLRFTLIRVSAADQVHFFKALFGWLGDRFLSFGMDRNGVGLPVYQTLMDEYSEDALDAPTRGKVFGYSASDKVAVGLEDREPKPWETEDDLILKQYASRWGAGELRRIVDQGLVELPYDTELIAEWLGERKPDERTLNARVKNKMEGASAISLHTLDASVNVLQARSLPDIEARLFPKREPVLETFSY